MAAPTLAAEGAIALVTTGSVTPTIGAGSYLHDDVLLATVFIWAPSTASAIADIPTPTDWNKLGEVDLASGDGGIAWFWRRMVGSGGPSATQVFARDAGWDTGTDSAFAATVDVIRGCANTGNPFDAFAMSAAYTTANQNTPAVTVSGAERLVLFYGAHTVDSATAQFTARTGYTMGTGAASTTGTGGGFRSARSSPVSSSVAAAASTHTAPAAGRHYAFGGISFKPVVPTATPVARVSLAAGATPPTRTQHQIVLRARKASGTGTVLLNAALYEGANNRSGDLVTGALTTSLATYTLAIADASAANITSYADLELRLWATSATGDAVAVEAAEAWLEAPASTGPQTHFGATAMPITVARAVAGTRRTFGVVARPVTFAAATAGLVRTTHFGVTSLAAAFGAVTQGRRKAFGVVARPSTFAAVTQGQRKTFGQVARPFTFAAVSSARRKTFGAVAAPVSFAAVVQGRRRSTGATSLVATFGAAVQGRRRTFGSTARPITFAALVDGRKLAAGIYGSVAAVYAFGSSASGRRRTFGRVARPVTFTAASAARRQTFGQVVLPLTFDAQAAARLGVFGRFALPLTLGVVTAGRLVAVVAPPRLAVTVVGGRAVTVAAAGPARVAVNGTQSAALGLTVSVSLLRVTATAERPDVDVASVA